MEKVFSNMAILYFKQTLKEGFAEGTLLKIEMEPENDGYFKRKLIFQGAIYTPEN